MSLCQHLMGSRCVIGNRCTWTYCFAKTKRVIDIKVSQEPTLAKMYVNSWDDFEKAAERLYLQDPAKTRYSLSYNHKKGYFKVKMTDDVQCLQYKTEVTQDVKKMEKFINHLMRHMASKEH